MKNSDLVYPMLAGGAVGALFAGPWGALAGATVMGVAAEKADLSKRINAVNTQVKQVQQAQQAQAQAPKVEEKKDTDPQPQAA